MKVRSGQNVTFNFTNEFSPEYTKEDWLQNALKTYDMREDGWQPSQTSAIKLYQSKSSRKYLNDLKERLGLPHYFMEDDIYDHMKDNVFKVGHRYKNNSTNLKEGNYKIIGYENNFAILNGLDVQVSLVYMLHHFETISLTDKRNNTINSYFNNKEREQS